MRLLVLAAFGAIMVLGAMNIRITGDECLAAFAEDDRQSIFASCDATEFQMAIRDFDWHIQEPDDYLTRQCADASRSTTRLCTSRGD